MLHKLRTRAQDEKGFTLIELLVVILIIGILAAIALPAFLNQRTKAQDTEAKSKARTAQTALETLYVNEQSYATATPPILQGIEPSLGDGPALDRPDATRRLTGPSRSRPSAARRSPSRRPDDRRHPGRHPYLHPGQQGRLPGDRSLVSTRSQAVILRAKRASGPASSLRPHPLKTPPFRADTTNVFKKRSSSSQAGIIGLDLDPGHIAAAEVTVNGSLSLKRGAVTALRPGILRDGEVADVPALAEALKAFFAENGFSNRVRLGIANQRIVVRTLDLPLLEDEKALAAAVKIQAPDHIPMPMDEAVIDWQSLGTVQNATGQPAHARRGRRRPPRDGRAACRRRPRGRPEGRGHRPVRLRDGPRAGRHARSRAPCSTSASPASPTSPSPTRAAASSPAPPPADSTRWSTRSPSVAASPSSTRASGSSTSACTRPLEGVDGDADLVAAARAVLEEGVHQLADTVRNSLNFYRMQESAEQVEQGVLTGPAVAIPGFVEALSEQLRLPLTSAVVESQDAERRPRPSHGRGRPRRRRRRLTAARREGKAPRC